MQRNTNNKKNIFIMFIVVFLVGNTGFYLKERSKWIYSEQPYPKAKEWLIPANMMLVYGTTLTKLPFIDERSFIMKPIIELQDYFVSKYKENLPDDDAEKYLDWHTFKLRTYMIPNAKSVVLYTDDTYSYEETREANEKAWRTIESIVKYQAKDKEFNEIRYAAFLNLAFFYLKNASVYWVHERKAPEEISYMQGLGKYSFFFDIKMMFNDRKKMKRFYNLYDYVQSMDEYYKNNYPDIFNKLIHPYYKNNINYKMTDYVMRDLINSNKNNKQEICKNKYYKLHFKSKTNLLDIYKNVDQAGRDSIDKLLSHSVDKKIEKLCKIQGEVK